MMGHKGQNRNLHFSLCLGGDQGPEDESARTRTRGRRKREGGKRRKIVIS